MTQERRFLEISFVTIKKQNGKDSVCEGRLARAAVSSRDKCQRELRERVC